MKPFMLLMCLLAGTTGMAQQFSNRGTEFWTGYGLHYFMELGQNNSQEMVLYFSAEEAAHVTVTTRGASANTVKQYTVPANSVIVSDPMPKSGAADCRLFDYPISYGGQGSDRLFNRSVHIESDVPIVAYAHISGAGSSGATMLMPVESWGYSYFSLNTRQIIRGVATGDGCFSWLFVVADHDNTVVEITPSVPLRNGAVAGVPFRTTLNRGQIYQVVGAAISNIEGEDLTGTRVQSVANAAGDCYPVAVFSGSSSTAITCNGTNSGFADNLIQQIFPVHAWGKRYLTAPFSSGNHAAEMNMARFRVAVKDPATVVRRNGVVMSSLINDFYYEFESNTADIIEADKPILVAQYMPSMNDNVSNGGCAYTGLGDPEMIYLSPVEQSIKRVGFYRNTAAVVEVNYLTLIIPANGLSSLTIDGSDVFSHTYPHPNMPGYSVVVQRWQAAKAQCIVQSDSAFTAITYGMGRYDSYGYNAGTMINNLNGILNLHNTEGAAGAVHPFACRNSPAEISILMTYQPSRLVWHLGQLAYITPNADVVQNNPSPAGTVVYKGLTYYKYTLPGTYTFSQADTFRFEVSSTHTSIGNCNNTEKLPLDIIVKDISNTALFKYALSGCLPDRVKLKWDSTNADGYHFNKWLWTFPDNTTASTDTTGKLFPAAGIYPVQLKVTSEEGCIDDTTMNVIVPQETPCAQAPGPVTVPNAFSPNGDGINDTWEIRNLFAYPANTVEIFNRYGQRVFYSRGYAKPWDGGGLPLGVYYYVIDLKDGSGRLAGYVTILK